MKVYVDELPKRCLECGFCCKDDLGYWCQGREDVEAVFIADEMCIKERLMSCPLQSLADYTNQVRKEVCEEIRKTLFEYLKVNSMEELENLSLLDSTLTYDVITDKLDQIQGETK